MNSQIENILKSGNEDRVDISLSRYEQMRESINQYELENDKLQHEKTALMAFVKKLGIPKDIDIIPGTMKVKQMYDTLGGKVKYEISFTSRLDRREEPWLK